VYDETVAEMEPTTQAVPGYFVWEVPGQAVVIHLNLDVVDRMGADIMRGFGALPKRGAEVGGVLLGSIENGDVTIVRVKDYETVPCQYKRGPSYLFTEDAQEAFDQACARWQPGESRPVYAIGYYRSHTRDGPLMTAEDIELLDRCFPLPAHIALLVKPFVTKASAASFFVRENGRFPETARAEFPFRRYELAPESAAEEPGPALFDGVPSEPVEEPSGVSTEVAPRQRRLGLPGWVWIPLSFVFLMLGLLLGYQAALTRVATVEGDAAFSLALSVTRTGDNLTVRWNRAAPAVRAAQKGLLEIEDGAYSKPVELDLAHLQGGSLIYRNSSNRVRFRLIVTLNARSNVTETLEWRQ
jgi:hypothetical protein